MFLYELQTHQCEHADCFTLMQPTATVVFPLQANAANTDRSLAYLAMGYRMCPLHCGIVTQTNESHIATLRECVCHFAIWADSSRLHNRAASCILQLPLSQCSTYRKDWTASARKEACENCASVHAHLTPIAY